MYVCSFKKLNKKPDRFVQIFFMKTKVFEYERVRLGDDGIKHNLSAKGDLKIRN